MVSKKEELASKVGMQFEEAVELFSEETLNNMLMIHVVGGGEVKKNGCGAAHCKSCDDDKCGGSNCIAGCACPTVTTPTPSSSTSAPSTPAPVG